MDLTTPTFFISFETVVMLNRVGSDVNKGLLPPVLLLLDEAELGGHVMAEFCGPCGTTGDPFEGKDLAL